MVSVPICNFTGLEPIRRTGSNLVQVIDRGTIGDVCIACDCPHFETNVAVLGLLEPGTYSLTVALRSGYPPIQMTNFSFRVLSNSQPTLVRLSLEESALFGNDQDTFFGFYTAGVAGPLYQVQTSSNFVHWTGIYTSVGAPFIFLDPILTNASTMFYRVAISPDGAANYPH